MCIHDVYVRSGDAKHDLMFMSQEDQNSWTTHMAFKPSIWFDLDPSISDTFYDWMKENGLESPRNFKTLLNGNKFSVAVRDKHFESLAKIKFLNIVETSQPT